MRQKLNQSTTIQKRYNRYSKYYDILESPMELVFSKWRNELINYASGNVLEVGVGTGKNIHLYPPHIKITAIDFSEGMLKQAKRKFHSKSNITFHNMDIQQTEFEDHSFDTILASYVFCSVPDPILGLKELRRICKDGEKIFLLEHTRSEKVFLGKLMDILNPFFVNLFGYNINRRTYENISNAGFRNIDQKILWLDIFKLFIITNRK